MSTFEGIVGEFPDIRIDYFRQSPSQGRRPALAYFLSHVHSDHLQGLETCRSPFIWCSPATREILLRLEKYPHRMNFAKGIVECRQQTYKHLRKILRPIPLDTPTEIELVPGRSLRVTLLDANHCVGAVMFLIEGDGKAVLYTGDIRAEIWWVNALVRNPVLVPYAREGDSMPLKRLDTIYLDTTFASKSDRYRHFPTKAEGLHELLQKVAQYPPDTEFYVDAWTFGYEDVWQALSVFLRSQIHVDEYRYGLYNALHTGPEPKAPEAYKLIRSRVGNEEREGCLSTRYRRIHSCERGTGCAVFNNNFVRITPIISRYEGVEMLELGAGGGHGDLNQQHELELDDGSILQKLTELRVEQLRSEPQVLSAVVQMLTEITSGGASTINLELADLAAGDGLETPIEHAGNDSFEDVDELPLERLVPILARRMRKKLAADMPFKQTAPTARAGSLPKQITFPYSRHASYGELCALIEAFLPKNIHPCTIDNTNWGPEHCMSYLFGHLYKTPPEFRHDKMMLHNYNAFKIDVERHLHQTQVSDADTQESFRSVHAGSQQSSTARATALSFVPGLDHIKKRRDATHSLGAAKRQRRSTGDTQWLSGAVVIDIDEADSAMLSDAQPVVSRQAKSEMLHNARTPDMPLPSTEIVDLSAANSSIPEPEVIKSGRGRSEQGHPHAERNRIYVPSTTPAAVMNTQRDYTELSGLDLRAALQRNAFDTVLGDCSEWSLVSVEGHGTREEEL